MVSAAAIALTAGIVSAGPASANLGNTSFINGISGNMCLDAKNDATHSPSTNGDPVQLWSCNGGTQQHWNFNENVGSYGTVTNAASGKCLDATNDASHNPGTNGDPVQLWTCNGGAQQQWKLVLQANIPNTYALINLYSYAQALDATSDATHNPGTDGDPAQLWSWTGTENQLWRF